MGFWRWSWCNTAVATPNGSPASTPTVMRFIWSRASSYTTHPAEPSAQRSSSPLSWGTWVNVSFSLSQFGRPCLAANRVVNSAAFSSRTAAEAANSLATTIGAGARRATISSRVSTKPIFWKRVWAGALPLITSSQMWGNSRRFDSSTSRSMIIWPTPRPREAGKTPKRVTQLRPSRTPNMPNPNMAREGVSRAT